MHSIKQSLYINLDCNKIKTIFVIAYLCFMYHNIVDNKLFVHHEHIKNGGTTYKNIVKFCINNSYILYIIMIAIIMYIERIK